MLHSVLKQHQPQSTWGGLLVGEHTQSGGTEQYSWENGTNKKIKENKNAIKILSTRLFIKKFHHFVNYSYENRSNHC